jgi:hypothetical protein
VDHCADGTCGTGTYCEYATGNCLPDLCAAKSCSDCAPATGECMAHPCASVQCPSCYACALTPDGTPFCQQQTTCGPTVALETGSAGGGCHCALGAGRPGPDAFLWVIGGMLALGATRRGRRGGGGTGGDRPAGTFGAR